MNGDPVERRVTAISLEAALECEVLSANPVAWSLAAEFLACTGNGLGSLTVDGHPYNVKACLFRATCLLPPPPPFFTASGQVSQSLRDGGGRRACPSNSALRTFTLASHHLADALCNWRCGDDLSDELHVTMRPWLRLAVQPDMSACVKRPQRFGSYAGHLTASLTVIQCLEHHLAGFPDDAFAWACLGFALLESEVSSSSATLDDDQYDGVLAPFASHDVVDETGQPLHFVRENPDEEADAVGFLTKPPWELDAQTDGESFRSFSNGVRRYNEERTDATATATSVTSSRSASRTNWVVATARAPGAMMALQATTRVRRMRRRNEHELHDRVDAETCFCYSLWAMELHRGGAERLMDSGPHADVPVVSDAEKGDASILSDVLLGLTLCLAERGSREEVRIGRRHVMNAKEMLVWASRLRLLVGAQSSFLLQSRCRWTTPFGELAKHVVAEERVPLEHLSAGSAAGKRDMQELHRLFVSNDVRSASDLPERYNAYLRKDDAQRAQRVDTFPPEPKGLPPRPEPIAVVPVSKTQDPAWGSMLDLFRHRRAKLPRPTTPPDVAEDRYQQARIAAIATQGGGKTTSSTAVQTTTNRQSSTAPPLPEPQPAAVPSRASSEGTLMNLSSRRPFNEAQLLESISKPFPAVAGGRPAGPSLFNAPTGFQLGGPIQRRRPVMQFDVGPLQSTASQSSSEQSSQGTATSDLGQVVRR